MQYNNREDNFRGLREIQKLNDLSVHCQKSNKEKVFRDSIENDIVGSLNHQYNIDKIPSSYHFYF